jgi:cell division protein FtsQ
MKYKAIILKVLNIMLWFSIGSGILILMVSSIQKEQQMKCKSLVVEFIDNKPFRMLNESEIMEALWPSQTNDHPVGKYINSINLFSLEKQLKKNPWVLDANLYFDQKNVLHVDVEQRTPVARIFSPEGNSFYIDDSLYLLPLKSSDVVELPVFTNYNIHAGSANAADTAIMKRITGLASFIGKDPFWMAQIEQVNINEDASFEMITQLGDQYVNLGYGANWNAMLSKLKKLYQHLGTERGWTKYESFDLQFRDQVVCVRRGISYAVQDSSLMDSVTVRPMSDTSDKINLQTIHH